ncbi:hypothetical protein VTI28DRAFT_2590 [Corynascus sepedonium]
MLSKQMSGGKKNQKQPVVFFKGNQSVIPTCRSKEEIIMKCKSPKQFQAHAIICIVRRPDGDGAAANRIAPQISHSATDTSRYKESWLDVSCWLEATM